MPTPINERPRISMESRSPTHIMKIEPDLPTIAKRYFIGIDVGTSSARACIVDEAGELISEKSAPIKTWHSRRDNVDYYEQSTENIWQACCANVRSVVSAARVNTKDIKGIGIDATCSMAVTNRGKTIDLSRNNYEEMEDGWGKGEKNVILWMDHRAHMEAADINEGIRLGWSETLKEVLKDVGGKVNPEMAMPKILWLKRNMPREIWEGCEFFDLADYLTYRMTCNTARGRSNVACFPGVDQSWKVDSLIEDDAPGTFRTDFLTAIGLEDLAKSTGPYCSSHPYISSPRLGNEFLMAGEPVARKGLAEEAAVQLGLQKETPVGSGVIDCYAGWLGTAGATHPDSPPVSEGRNRTFSRLAVVAGTSSCHILLHDKKERIPGLWGPWAECFIPGTYMSEAGQSATGSLIEYVVKSHKAYPKALEAAAKNEMDVYQWLNKRLAQMAKEQRRASMAEMALHLHVLPDFHGNRTPRGDPRMRGSIVGLNLSSDDVDALALMYYATIEAIGLQTREIIDTFERKQEGTGKPLDTPRFNIREIVMSGGQSKNKLLVQVMANTTGLPVVLPKYVNSTVVIGAAILGARAAEAKLGFGGRVLSKILEDMSKAGERVSPTADVKEKRILEAKYKVLLKMSDDQAQYREIMDSSTEIAERI
ncbi:hypothetical protein YB2330_005502 [Saitoella coloradoensis]